MFGDLIYEKSTLHLDGNCLRKCAYNDIQCIYFPLKLPNLYHSEIFWCSWFMTPILSAPLAETLYYICFYWQMSCFIIGIEILRLLLIYPLSINQLIFDYVNLCIHVKGTMWSFLQNLAILPILWMDSPLATCMFLKMMINNFKWIYERWEINPTL